MPDFSYKVNDEMKKLILLPRFLALWLILCLSLPSPAGVYAEPGRSTLRDPQTQEKSPEFLSGLEEALGLPSTAPTSTTTRAVSPSPAAGMEEDEITRAAKMEERFQKGESLSWDEVTKLIGDYYSEVLSPLAEGEFQRLYGKARQSYAGDARGLFGYMLPALREAESQTEESAVELEFRYRFQVLQFLRGIPPDEERLSPTETLGMLERLSTPGKYLSMQLDEEEVLSFSKKVVENALSMLSWVDLEGQAGSLGVLQKLEMWWDLSHNIFVDPVQLGILRQWLRLMRENGSRGAASLVRKVLDGIGFQDDGRGDEIETASIEVVHALASFGDPGLEALADYMLSAGSAKTQRRQEPRLPPEALKETERLLIGVPGSPQGPKTKPALSDPEQSALFEAVESLLDSTSESDYPLLEGIEKLFGAVHLVPGSPEFDRFLDIVLQIQWERPPARSLEGSLNLLGESEDLLLADAVLESTQSGSPTGKAVSYRDVRAPVVRKILLERRNLKPAGLLYTLRTGRSAPIPPLENMAALLGIQQKMGDIELAMTAFKEGNSLEQQAIILSAESVANAINRLADFGTASLHTHYFLTPLRVSPTDTVHAEHQYEEYGTPSLVLAFGRGGNAELAIYDGKKYGKKWHYETSQSQIAEILAEAGFIQTAGMEEVRSFKSGGELLAVYGELLRKQGLLQAAQVLAEQSDHVTTVVGSSAPQSPTAVIAYTHPEWEGPVDAQLQQGSIPSVTFVTSSYPAGGRLQPPAVIIRQAGTALPAEPNPAAPVIALRSLADVASLTPGFVYAVVVNKALAGQVMGPIVGILTFTDEQGRTLHAVFA